MTNAKEHPEYRPEHGDMTGYRYIEFGEIISENTEVWEYGIGPWAALNFKEIIGKPRKQGRAPMRIALPKWEPKQGLPCLYKATMKKYTIVGHSFNRERMVVIEDKDGYILLAQVSDLKEWIEPPKEYRMGIFFLNKQVVATCGSNKTHEVVWPENGEPRIEKVNN